MQQLIWNGAEKESDPLTLPYSIFYFLGNMISFSLKHCKEQTTRYILTDIAWIATKPCLLSCLSLLLYCSCNMFSWSASLEWSSCFSSRDTLSVDLRLRTSASNDCLSALIICCRAFLCCSSCNGMWSSRQWLIRKTIFAGPPNFERSNGIVAYLLHC